MLAGGAEEAVCQASLAGFSNLRALSRRNDDPAAASRPFDADVHPTLNVKRQDPEIDIDCSPKVKSKTTARYGSSNSFGFGDHNSCVVIEKGD
jgi:3-oxoacyl-(acyl-carrier-protein) synthase